MPRLFTYITNDNIDFELLVGDYINQTQLSEIEMIQNLVANTSVHDTINFEIYYMVFLDSPELPIAPATESELEQIFENLSTLLSEKIVIVDKSYDLSVPGSNEELDIIESYA